jgi:hypothetical protein
MSRLKAWQPRQRAKTDSSVAATTSSARNTSATVVAPASQQIDPAVVIVAPSAWAKRFGGPATSLGAPSRGAATRVASCASGLSVGPVSTRAQKP